MTAPRPARRFLHVCYCCSDADPVTRFFVDGLAMRNTMGTPNERSDGAILGLEGEIESGAAFVYDRRGARVGPAIEVQGWVDPPIVGRPLEDPTAVGVHALGFAVPDLDATGDDLVKRGCTIVASGRSPFGDAWTTLRDATGVTLDLVADPGVAAGETRMRHVRITCSDLARSLEWYRGLGFELVGEEAVAEAGFLGMDGRVDAVAARLRLPDEPFEVLLVQWREPASHGRHYAEPNHAGIYRMAVGVDDTRAAYGAMAAEGWAFDRAPMLIELKGTPVPDMWICFISDPDGVPFEFVGRPRDAFTA